MDPINQQQTAQAPMPQATEQRKKVGPIIAILVVVLILVIGALYLFASNVTQAPVTDTPQSVQPVTNTADDVQSLEADLNSATAGLEEQNF